MPSPLSFEQKATKLAVEQGLKKCFDKPWFNLCGLDEAAAALGIKKNVQASSDYQTLVKLHCMDWELMDPDMHTEVRNRVYRLLAMSLEPTVLENDIQEIWPISLLPASPISKKETGTVKSRWWNR